MKRLLVICLFQLVTVPFLSSQSNPAKQIGGWVITPPHLTYPVNNTATAALASSTNPSVSLVLEARFQPAGNRPQDAGKGTALLSVAIVSDKDHFQADPLLALKGVPVTMSFDGGKPIALRWDGGDAFINLDLKPGSLVLQFLAKLEGSKTLTISYPISDCPMKTIDLYGSPTIFL